MARSNFPQPSVNRVIDNAAVTVAEVGAVI